MNTAKCVLAALSLLLLAGCILHDDGGDGPYFDRGQGEFRDHDGGQERGIGQERSNFR
jgi:hypothetical protein